MPPRALIGGCSNDDSDLVVENDWVILLGSHGLLNGRPNSLVARRGDPFLSKLFALELEFESIIVIRGRGALNDGAALEHLHANIALVLCGFRYKRVVEEIEHLFLFAGRDVHL